MSQWLKNEFDKLREEFEALKSSVGGVNNGSEAAKVFEEIQHLKNEIQGLKMRIGKQPPK